MKISIKIGWLYIVTLAFIIGIFQIDINAEIIGGDNPWQKKEAYHPYPILFLHGFAGGSNYTWNPDPNAKNQAEEQKKPTAVLNKYFEKYFDVNLALRREGYPFTQFPYLETIEFFNSKSSPQEQLMDRNSSVDRFKIGDYYVEHGVWWHKKQEGDPGWADKVSYALKGVPIHELSKYLYDPSLEVGGGPVLQNYLPPNATSFKALLVCHSMGGLSAREYLTNKTFYPGAEGSVVRLITIDTPHLGSALAVLADATTAVQEIATSVSITYPQFGWLMAAPVVIEVIDNGLQLFSKIDIDGDAVNDMDPLSLLGRFGSGFLGQLNARAHPQGVQYYIVYGSLPFAQIIDGFSIQGFINSLMGKGISIEEVEELLEKEYGAEIGVGEIIVTEIGDGVVSENSQRGILKEENGSKIRVFEIAKESIKGIPTEIGVNADHSAATKKAVEIETDDVPPLLKLIDYTKPRLEIASPQEGFIWESGVTITLEGKVYDEYLPADSSLKIELYKAGDNFNPVYSEIRKPDPITGYTPLKPSNLWRASDSNTPVAEFKEEMSLPNGVNPEATYTIKLTVINPAVIISEPVEVTEKTWFMYGVGRSDDETAKLWCMDGPTSFADGVAAIVSEFSLVDETGYNISARPLDIATSGNTIWISFDNRRIYSYNITTMKPQLVSGGYYYTTTGTPDGLYYDGNLQYCSSVDNKIYRLNLSNGQETEVGVINRKLSLNDVVPEPWALYTTQEYGGYNPTGISANYMCSLGKISKRDTSMGQNFLQTIPAITPIWTNEQDTPAPVVGIVEVADSSVPGGKAIYLSSTDGNIYKVRSVDKTTNQVGTALWIAQKQDWPGATGNTLAPGTYYYANQVSVIGSLGRMQSWDGPAFFDVETFTSRVYLRIVPPISFIEAFCIRRHLFSKDQNERDDTVSGNYVDTVNPSPMASATYSICSFDESWNAEQKFNNPVLSTHLWTQPYGGTNTTPEYELDSKVRVTNITGQIPNTTFYYTGRYDDENQTFPVTWPLLIRATNLHILYIYTNPMRTFDIWSFLTDEGSLETQDQFSMASGIAEGIAIGPRVKIIIEPQELSLRVGQTGQLKVNGKGPYTWSSSDDTVVAIEGDNLSGTTVTVKTVGVGTATITVQDSLGNVAKVTVNVSAF